MNFAAAKEINIDMKKKNVRRGEQNS